MTAFFPVPDIVMSQVKAGHSREVLRHMTDALELALGIQALPIFDALMTAEATGGSAIGDGVAVVSARVPVLHTNKRIGGFAVLARPVMFRGVETHPCDLVYVMVSPEDQAQAHLRDLSTIVRSLRDRDFIERIRATTGNDRVMNLFRAIDGAHRAAA